MAQEQESRGTENCERRLSIVGGERKHSYATKHETTDNAPNGCALSDVVTPAMPPID